MAATGRHRGHLIRYINDDTWIYVDTREPVFVTKDRDCGFCGLANTTQGHDGCLGTLPDVMNACCGHGRADDAYIQFNDGRYLAGIEALRVMST